MRRNSSNAFSSERCEPGSPWHWGAGLVSGLLSGMFFQGILDGAAANEINGGEDGRPAKTQGGCGEEVVLEEMESLVLGSVCPVNERRDVRSKRCQGGRTK